MANESAENQVSFIARGPQFVKESLEELKKVSRPTRQETIQATMVAILIMLIVATVLWFCDWIFYMLMFRVLH